MQADETTSESFCSLAVRNAFVTIWRRRYDMIWLRKTETYLGVVEFFFSLEEGKDA
jgi:hypothetical protein